MIGRFFSLAVGGLLASQVYLQVTSTGAWDYNIYAKPTSYTTIREERTVRIWHDVKKQENCELDRANPAYVKIEGHFFSNIRHALFKPQGGLAGTETKGSRGDTIPIRGHYFEIDPLNDKTTFNIVITCTKDDGRKVFAPIGPFKYVKTDGIYEERDPNEYFY